MTKAELNEVCIAHRKVIARLIDRLDAEWNERDNVALILVSDDFGFWLAERNAAEA